MNKNDKLPVAIGLDIGSANVRCVIGIQEENGVSVVGFSRVPNQGVRKGVIADIEDTVSAITAAVDEAERISGIQVTHASVNVNGAQIITINSRGIVAIGGMSREITQDDVMRVEEAATVLQLPPNREIIHAFPVNYIIDGQEHIKDPTGMNGMRLEVEMALVTGSAPFIKNITKAVNQVGITPESMLVSPLAAARAFITKQQKEIGCVVVDIGAGTTGLAVYEEGELLHLAIIPVGSSHITNDIAVGLRTDIETAERIKLDHVNAENNDKKKSVNHKIKELSGEAIMVSQAEVSSIAQARLDELFDLVNKELHKIKRDYLLPGGALLCGGGAQMTGIDALAKKRLKIPAQVMYPRSLAGLANKVSTPDYSVAVGLMLANLEVEHSHAPWQASFELVKDKVINLVQRFRKK